MKIVVKKEWLEATGNQHLIGVELPAVADPDMTVNSSPMGTCYVATLPDGREWTVFACRLEAKKNDTLAFNTGRQYTDKGQRISAELVDGMVCFFDHDRLIGGKFELQDFDTFNEALVLQEYDAHRYGMWLPAKGQMEWAA